MTELTKKPAPTQAPKQAAKQPTKQGGKLKQALAQSVEAEQKQVQTATVADTAAPPQPTPSEQAPIESIEQVIAENTETVSLTPEQAAQRQAEYEEALTVAQEQWAKYQAREAAAAEQEAAQIAAKEATEQALHDAGLVKAIVELEMNIGQLTEYLGDVQNPSKNTLLGVLREAEAALKKAEADYKGAVEGNKPHFKTPLEQAQRHFLAAARKYQVVNARISKASAVLEQLDAALLG